MYVKVRKSATCFGLRLNHKHAQFSHEEYKILQLYSILCVKRFTSYILPHGATVPIGQGLPHYRGFTLTLRHTTLRLISPTQRPLPDRTHSTHKCQRDSNPQSLQKIRRRPTPQTAQPLASGHQLIQIRNYEWIFHKYVTIMA